MLFRSVEKLGMVPGKMVCILEVGPFDGPITIELEGRTMHLGPKVADAIQVEPMDGTSSSPEPESHAIRLDHV